MQVATIHKAKTHLSDLIKKAEAGEDIVICKAGRPIVRLIKYNNLTTPRKSGIWTLPKISINYHQNYYQLFMGMSNELST